MRIKVLNKTRATTLADNAEVANTSESRRKGLLGRTGLSAGGGLWIAPCEAVHCFFMKFTIDILFLDKQKKVVKVAPGVRPWRIAGSLKADSVLELPEGVIQATGTQVGDQIEMVKIENNP